MHSPTDMCPKVPCNHHDTFGQTMENEQLRAFTRHHELSKCWYHQLYTLAQSSGLVWICCCEFSSSQRAQSEFELLGASSTECLQQRAKEKKRGQPESYRRSHCQHRCSRHPNLGRQHTRARYEQSNVVTRLKSTKIQVRAHNHFCCLLGRQKRPSAELSQPGGSLRNPTRRRWGFASEGSRGPWIQSFEPATKNRISFATCEPQTPIRRCTWWLRCYM